jgi:hypothetical protein
MSKHKKNIWLKAARLMEAQSVASGGRYFDANQECYDALGCLLIAAGFKYRMRQNIVDERDWDDMFNEIGLPFDLPRDNDHFSQLRRFNDENTDRPDLIAAKIREEADRLFGDV